ncbi:hypothetical protein BaRGS_00021772 [Batillaria attramentaria]|uniref:Protein cramped n=1 Tax=Batillaria attramentaria TaxID=370345 RepID=A0ABD0KIB9_9CAEN
MPLSKRRKLSLDEQDGKDSTRNSKFEQDAFFEGLFEYGKDFDAIQSLIYHRSKKRGIDASLIKRKEQVRHMYYRTWQKIVKHVHMDEEVKKETQELYGLVNYAVFRKTFKSLNERSAVHLNELIHTGVSKVKKVAYGKRKKNITKCLRTPICNALKKLNNIEETKEEILEIPQQVTVEITPRNSAGWLRVHNMSQNPRVRFHLSANRSLASIIEHLRKKWKSVDDRVRCEIGGEEDESEELVIFPHHSYTLNPVTIAAQRATSVDMIALSSYRENILDSPGAGGKTSRRSVDDPKPFSDNSSDAEAIEAPIDPPKPRRVGVRVNLFQKTSEPFSSCDDENAMFPDIPLSSSPLKDMSCADTNVKLKCSLLTADSSSEDHVTSTSNCDNENQRPGTPVLDASPHSKDKRELRDEERETDMRQLIDTAVKGFTRESCKLVTLAQLSLMLERTSHIRLEYEWKPKRLVNAAGGGGACVSSVQEKEPVVNMLRRLANLATLEYRDMTQRAKVAAGGRMSQCTLCGHQLERPTVSRRKTTSDVSTETEPLTLESVETLIPGAGSILRPTKLNSNGTIVGMSTNFVDKESLTPDRDGVFRVPMPLPVPVVRCSGQQRMSTQPAFSQLIRPPEPQPAKNFMVPRKRKQQRKPIIVQRTILPKMPTGQMILLPQNLPSDKIEQNIPQSTTITPVTSVATSAGVAVAPVSGPVMATLTPVTVTAPATVTSVDQLQTVPSVAVSEVLSDSTSDLFASNISMPGNAVTSTPTKSAQQLTQNSTSPPSLSSFLDISLPAPSNQGPDAGDKFLDMVLVNGNTGFTGLLKSPAKQGHVPDSAVNNNSLSTPPHSPRVSPLKMGAETQWLGGDEFDFQAADISLGSLLDTPIKKSDAGDSSQVGALIATSVSATTAAFIPAPPSLFGESSQDSLVAKLDVDTALQSVMTESSIDYSTKFERLAAHLADNTDSAQTGI